MGGPDGSGALVGTVDRVTRSESRVTLLTDSESAVTATDVTNPQVIGAVRRGGGSSDVLVLDRVPKSPYVRVGDTIVTAGSLGAGPLPSMFPRGILIGTVSSQSSTDANMFKNIQLKPFVDFSSLQSVIVLVPKQARLMDGVKAALVLFVAALLQLSVLTEYRPFRTASIVLVALLSIALLRGSVFGAVAGFVHRAAARHGDARHARHHLAAADARRLLDRPLRRDDRPRPLPRAVRLGRGRHRALLVRRSSCCSSCSASRRPPGSSRTACRARCCSTCC